MPKASVTRLTGLSIQPNANEPQHVLSIPAITTAQRTALVNANPSEIRNGSIYYDTTTNTYWANQNYVTAANGATTTAFIPLISIPNMTTAQGILFEAANTTAGQMYVNTTIPSIKIYNGVAWLTITAV
jgi:hypothetical protein